MKKKIISAVLVFMMVLGMPSLAFADPGSNNGNGNGNNGNGNGNSGNNGNQSAPVASDPLVYPLHQKGPIEWLSYREGSDFGLNEKKGETEFVPGYELGTEGTVLWHFVNPDKLGGEAYITFTDGCNDQIVGPVYSYKNDQHFAVVTPQSWVLLSAAYYPAKAPSKNGTQFNLSHTAGKIVEIKYGSLDITANINVKQNKLYYQEIWQKTYQPVWQKIYEPIWEPYYERIIVEDNTNTLVTSLDDKTGGAFNNGHTYVAVNIKAASEGELEFQIADSSPQNRPIGYSYFVSITGDSLNIYFKDVVSANIGAYLVDDAKDFPGNAPSHHGTSLSLSLPTDANEDGYYLLYFHNAGGIKWYGEETKQVGYKFTGCYKLVSNEFLRDDLLCDKYVFTRYVGCEAIEGFDIVLGLVVTNEAGEEVYNGKIDNNATFSLDKLLPGIYTCALTISVDGNETKTIEQKIEVFADEAASVSFKDVVLLCPIIEYCSKTYLPPIFLWKSYEEVYPEELIAPVIP